MGGRRAEKRTFLRGRDYRGWEIYGFYFKKEKGKKKKSITKNTAQEPILRQTGKEKRATGRFQKRGAPVFEELYELFKDYFHMAASDTEDFAVRDT